MPRHVRRKSLSCRRSGSLLDSHLRQRPGTGGDICAPPPYENRGASPSKLSKPLDAPALSPCCSPQWTKLTGERQAPIPSQGYHHCLTFVILLEWPLPTTKALPQPLGQGSPHRGAPGAPGSNGRGGRGCVPGPKD